MRVRSSLAKMVVTVVALTAAATVFLWLQSPSERWLMLCSGEAEQHAKQMLKGDSSTKWPPADCLIDVYIATDPKSGTALFAPHDNHDIAVIYAPLQSSEQMIYYQQVAHRIRPHWYEL